MKIKNLYHKRLSFEFDDLGSFSIEAGEEKSVDSQLGERLLGNSFIKEVKSFETKVEKIKSKKQKHGC